MNLPHEFNEASELVYELNDEFEFQPETRPLAIVTDGCDWKVKFFDEVIWTSDEDERESAMDGDGDEQLEPIKDYILRQVQTMIDSIGKVKLTEEAKSRIDPMAPVGELKGAFPLVLYFPTEHAKEEFIEMFKQAKPNIETRNL